VFVVLLKNASGMFSFNFLKHCDSNNTHKQFLSQQITKFWNSLPAAAAIDFTVLLT